MKKIFTLLLIPVLALFSSCKGIIPDDDPEDLMWYAVEKGTVVYNYSDSEDGYRTCTYIFDDYGRRERFEIDGTVLIHDDTENRTLFLDTETKQYMTQDNSSHVMAMFIFLGEDAWAGAKAYGATKKTETIAGKSCTVWSWKEGTETCSYGGWKRLCLVSEYDSEESSASYRHRAQSFSSTISSTAFDIPAGYTEIVY